MENLGSLLTTGDGCEAVPQTADGNSWWHISWGQGVRDPNTVRLPLGDGKGLPSPRKALTLRESRLCTTWQTPFTTAALHLGPQFLGSHCAWHLEARPWGLKGKHT